MMATLLRRQAPAAEEPNMPDGILPLDSMASVDTLEETLSDGNRSRQLVSLFCSITMVNFNLLYINSIYDNV